VDVDVLVRDVLVVQQIDLTRLVVPMRHPVVVLRRRHDIRRRRHVLG
jgi:hypothetical protein